MDKVTLALILKLLAAICILSILGLIVLAFAGEQADATRTGLVSIATASLGALGALLVQPTRD